VDVTVAVATYGDEKWKRLAQRAIASAEPQAPVVHVHGDTLHGARNAALEQVKTEWVCHLDSDDELEPGYVEALAAGTADLRAPAVRYVARNTVYRPRMPRVAGHRHDCTAECLPEGNWLVVGTAAPAQLLRDVGGWRDFPWSEDWDLWLRCHLAGATFEAIPSAVYRAHVDPRSRNRAPDRIFKLAAHRAIHRANFPDQYDEAAA
jgi:glycosyltransferase involved in cell wall biosynthesis